VRSWQQTGGYSGRAALTLYLADAGIAVQADDEDISLARARVRGSECSRDGATAVGEDDAAAVAFLAAKPQTAVPAHLSFPTCSERQEALGPRSWSRLHKMALCLSKSL
jgi:hypothetical protein